MTAHALQLKGEPMRQAPLKFVTAITATRKQEDAGEAPIMLSIFGPSGGTKAHAQLTLEAAKATAVQLMGAIDATEREQASL